MAKAIWNGTIIAETDDIEIVEGNAYFPANAVKREYVRQSDTHTVCPWKGVASYYHVVVDSRTNPDAAWYYPETAPAANHIKGRIAFWHGVRVER